MSSDPIQTIWTKYQEFYKKIRLPFSCFWFDSASDNIIIGVTLIECKFLLLWQKKLSNEKNIHPAIPIGHGRFRNN